MVEVDTASYIPQHHMVLTPQSPVSLLQNSPLYSPVKDPICSPTPVSYRDTELEVEIDCTSVEGVKEAVFSVWSSNDSDEGIESEEGETEHLNYKK